MEKLNIPKTIHVGYQKRTDTYTGKLAYVIYTDEKGVKRKECSWDSWRDSKIAPDDYENVPIAGFVLNKGVGGARQSWGWNARNEYIRVFDPRGFEFEISVANLLFILTQCTSTKGKGLEGEFVYSWDGKDLILLPVDCYEYDKSVEFTALKSLHIPAKELVPGTVYMDKDMRNLLYLGKHKVRKCDSGGYMYSGYSSIEMKAFFEQDFSKEKNKHVFKILSNDPKLANTVSYFFATDSKKIASVISENHPEYADSYVEFMGSKYISEFEGFCLEKIEKDEMGSTGYYGDYLIEEIDKGFYTLLVYSSRLEEVERNQVIPRTAAPFIISMNETGVIISDIENIRRTERSIDRNCYRRANDPNAIGKNQIINSPNDFYTLKLKFKSGTKIGVYNYVK